MRAKIKAELSLITPGDDLEEQHLEACEGWIDSGAELFRQAKPAMPPQHLVSYFVVVDGDHVLLVDHKNAQLWLPSGGHVEPGEHPRDTVRRELKEELGLDVEEVGPPLLLTIQETVGQTAGHTDVSLWYVVQADRHQEIQFDAGEFHNVRWFTSAEAPLDRSDPHLGRFLTKLRNNGYCLPEPAVDTERLQVCRYRSEHEAGFVKMASDPKAMNALSGPLPDPAGRFRSFLGVVRSRKGAWAITDKATGEFVGHIFVFKGELADGFELGFVISPEFWRRGYASQAAAGLVKCLDCVDPTLKLCATVDSDNAGSIKVLGRAGFVHVETRTDEEGPYEVYARVPTRSGSVF